METKIIDIDENKIDMKKIREAATLLDEGGLVAFPTETVYGLGADAFNPEAVASIFKAKGRPGDNPLIVHIHNFQQLYDLAEDISSEAKLLAEKFWPGPLTMILPCRENVPEVVTAGLNTVAVRMPQNKVALAILQECAHPVAAPSANLSGRPSPTKASHVIEDLMGKIDAVVVAENSRIGIESTVIDLTVSPAVILRPGSITIEDLQKYIDVIDDTSGYKDIPRSPGTKYRHYAPKGDLFVITGNFEEKMEKIGEILSSQKNKKIGLMVSKELGARIGSKGVKGVFVLEMGSINSPEKIRANFYALLREFDLAEVQTIYLEEIPEAIIGKAYRNRVEKASGGKFL